MTQELKNKFISKSTNDFLYVLDKVKIFISKFRSQCGIFIFKLRGTYFISPFFKRLKGGFSINCRATAGEYIYFLIVPGTIFFKQKYFTDIGAILARKINSKIHIKNTGANRI